MSEKSFEDLMKDLNSTLEKLEKGDLSLEDSMKSYEAGIKTSRLLEERLKKMEGRMEEILADGSVNELKVDVSEN